MDMAGVAVAPMLYTSGVYHVYKVYVGQNGVATRSWLDQDEERVALLWALHHWILYDHHDLVVCCMAHVAAEPSPWCSVDLDIRHISEKRKDVTSTVHSSVHYIISVVTLPMVKTFFFSLKNVLIPCTHSSYCEGYTMVHMG